MIEIRIDPNPNCGWSGQVVFSDLDAPRRISAIRADAGGGDELCDIVGVETGGAWAPARALKVADSGEGTAVLIYGGPWGIRLRPRRCAAEPWDLADRRQWGEPYKVYGSSDDIVWEEDLKRYGN